MREIAREANWILEKRSMPDLIERTRKHPILRQRHALAFGLISVGIVLSLPLILDLGLLILAIVAAGVLFWIGVGSWFAKRLKDRQREFEALSGEFNSVSGHFVSVIIRQGDAPTGWDQGVLWFEDGHLYFAGRRTSFGLVPGQARALAPPHPILAGVRNAVELALRRDTAAGGMALSFEPLLPPHESVPVHRQALRSDLDQWLGEWAEGPGQLPPTTFGPDIVSEGRLLAEALLATASLPMIVYLLTLPYHWGTIVALNVLILIVAAFPGSNLRWRALRDRRRLRRGG